MQSLAFPCTGKRALALLLLIIFFGLGIFSLLHDNIEGMYGATPNAALDYRIYQDERNKEIIIKPPGNTTSKDETQQQRQERIRFYCQQPTIKSESNIDPGRFLVLHKQKLIVCAIPKVGSTMWRDLFKKKFEQLDEYSFEEQEKLLHSYKKVMFVRHPVPRIWSGYNDKFVNKQPIEMSMQGRYIIKRFRSEPTSVAMRCGHDVRLKEFLMYLAADVRVSMQDKHWAPYHKQCDPCNIDYDYIGKLETFSTDWEKVNQIVTLPKTKAKKVSSLDEMIDASSKAPFFQERFRKYEEYPECLAPEFFLIGRLQEWVNNGFIDSTTMIGRSIFNNPYEVLCTKAYSHISWTNKIHQSHIVNCTAVEAILRESARHTELRKDYKYGVSAKDTSFIALHSKLGQGIAKELRSQTESDEEAEQLLKKRKKTTMNDAFKNISPRIIDSVLKTLQLDFLLYGYDSSV